MRELLRKGKSLLLTVFAMAAGGALAESLSYADHVPAGEANKTTVFEGVSLSDIGTTYALSANIAGAYIDNDSADGLAATVFSMSSEGGVLSVQFRVLDGGMCKAVTAKFSQNANGEDIDAYLDAASARLKRDTTSISAILNEGSTAGSGGYGLKNLLLTSTATSQIRESININFHNGTALSDSDSTPLGVAGYAVPTKVWDNKQGNNGDLTIVHKYDGSSTSVITDAKVTVSSASGSWKCNNMTATSDLRKAYIDDSGTYPSPTVTITNIPFEYYKVIVYHSNEDTNKKFGYDIINGICFSAIDGETVITNSTSASWGDSGAKDWALELGEGVNYLITPVYKNNSAKTLTLTAHRFSANVRAGVAGISIIKADAPETFGAVAITSPFDGSTLAAPTCANEYSTSATSVSFGNNSDFFQSINSRTGIVAKVTGGTYTDINGWMKQAEGTTGTDKDVFLVVSGGTATRINGVQEAHWQGGDRQTRTKGNAYVQIEDGATVGYVYAAGYKGGVTASDNQDPQVDGSTGVTIKGGTITGSVFGGWSSAHQRNAIVTGNTAVRMETLPAAASAPVENALVNDYVVGGSIYQSNSQSASTINGNSSVVLALDGKSGAFLRNIVGGSLYASTANNGGYNNPSGTHKVKGNSSVVISAPNDVSFGMDIVGGGCSMVSVTAGSAKVEGNSSVTVSGGIYTGTIVAGGYAPNGGTVAVDGKATLTLNSGVFTGATLKGGTATGAKELIVNNALDVSDANVQGFTQITVAGDGKVAIADTEVANLNALAIIGASGAIKVSGSAPALTIPADSSAGSQNYMNNGMLDLTGCTTLEELVLELGNATSFDLSHVSLPPSCTSVIVNGAAGEQRVWPYSITGAGEGVTVSFTFTETREEFGKGSFSVSNVPAGATVSVTRPDGMTTAAAVTDGTATIAGNGVRISGAATMYDATFTNTTVLAYKYNSGAGVGKDSGPSYNNLLNDTTTGMYIRHHPWISGISSYFNDLGNFTAVVIGQMSPSRKTQFIHMGCSNSGGTGILIATTENADEVIIAPNNEKNVDTSSENSVKVSVPNAATARHAYVIIRDGNTFSVWVDGVKRGNFSVADGFKLGTSNNSGIQVGSDFGGEIKNSSDENNFQAVPDSEDETGVVNTIRIFDYVISDAQKDTIFDAYPYVSQGGHYTRTITADANLSATDAWAKEGDENTYDLPVGATVDETFYNPSVTVTANAAATLAANADLTIDKLTVQSDNASSLIIASDGTHAIGVSDSAIVNSPLVVKYGALNLAGTPVTLGAGGTLAFDFSTLDFTTLTVSPTIIQLTGLVDQADEKVSVMAPAGTQSTFTLNYNALGFYEVSITPAAKIVTDSATSYYSTVSDAITAFGTDADTLTLYADSDEDITLSVGQILDKGTTTYTGTPSPTGEYIELAESGTTYTAVDNSTNTWKSSVTTGEWNDVANWENGVKPQAYTRVIFPANDDPGFTGYTVGLRLNGNSFYENTPVCAGMEVSAKVDMVQGEPSSTWGDIQLYGNISGTGTLALHKVGLYNNLESSTPITVSCNLSVAIKSATHDDCYFEGGPFVFSGLVTATANSYFKAVNAVTFNGLVTIENGAKVDAYSSGTTIYNGGISVPADAAALLEGAGRVTIASTVTLATGASLTIPNNAHAGSAAFVSGASGYKVTSAAGANNTTIYSLVAADMNPSSGTWTGDVTYDNSGSLSGDELTDAVVDAASFSVPVGSGIDEATYKTYFTYSTAPSATEGKYTLTVEGFSDEAGVIPTDTDALTGLSNAAVTAGSDVTVSVKPGLYYAFVTGTDISKLGNGRLELATGETMTYVKPADNTVNFVKVRVSASPDPDPVEP
ncbi:MAG: hypothetical protein J6P13_01590 [Kiritimatiellae bacterium]|nr:hypothetical protein [Kiritimatiellia bacterium]